MTRVGFGFDLHPLVDGRPLVLGGVTVPSARGLDGHSDADVLTHAIAEALLGALALGDLGRHFPDSDPRYRGISSLALLRRVVELVTSRGGRLVNVDATVLAEAPRLAPHLDGMAKRLAETLGLDIDRVSRVFTTGNLPSDLRRWNQLGVGDEWGKHAIHVYGTRDDGMTTTALRLARFGARPFVRHYEALPADRDVLEAVAGDCYGIGLAGFVAESDVPNAVRRLALSESPSTIASLASYEDVRAGRYALSPSLHFYVDRAPNSPLDPIAAEYIRLALSAEGQRILAELKDTAAGFVPLDPEEAARELAKLER